MSNGICSLDENKPRLAVVASAIVNNDGSFSDEKIELAVIDVKKSYSYAEAEKTHLCQDGEDIKNARTKRQLDLLYKNTKILENRYKNILRIDSHEPEYKFSEDRTNVEDIKISNNDLAEMLFNDVRKFREENPFASYKKDKKFMSALAPNYLINFAEELNKNKNINLIQESLNKTGAILSYFSNDLETVEEAFGFGIVQLIDGVFLLVLALIKMFRIQPILTSIALIPLVLLGLCAVLIDRYMEKMFEKRQKAFESLSDFAQENFTGIRVIKAFVKEKKEMRQFAKEAKKNKETNIGFVRASALLDVLFDFLIYAIFAIILIGGAFLVYNYVKSGGAQGISIGSLVEFIGYVDSLI